MHFLFERRNSVITATANVLVTLLPQKWEDNVSIFLIFWLFFSNGAFSKILHIEVKKKYNVNFSLWHNNHASCFILEHGVVLCLECLKTSPKSLWNCTSEVYMMQINWMSKSGSAPLITLRNCPYILLHHVGRQLVIVHKPNWWYSKYQCSSALQQRRAERQIKICLVQQKKMVMPASCGHQFFWMFYLNSMEARKSRHTYM